MPGRKGSPKMAKAAQLLIENPNYTAKVALLMAGYDNLTATSDRAKKTLSKNKNRLIEAVCKVIKEKARQTTNHHLRTLQLLLLLVLLVKQVI